MASRGGREPCLAGGRGRGGCRSELVASLLLLLLSPSVVVVVVACRSSRSRPPQQQQSTTKEKRRQQHDHKRHPDPPRLPLLHCYNPCTCIYIHVHSAQCACLYMARPMWRHDVPDAGLAICTNKLNWVHPPASPISFTRAHPTKS